MKTFLTILACSVSAFAHPNGTSKTAIRLWDPDSITITVNANHDDLVNAVHAGLSFSKDTKIRHADILLYQKRIAEYLMARVKLDVDHRSLEGLRVIRWKPNGKGPEDDLTDDSAAYWSNAHEITFGGTLPKIRHSLGINVQLFAEYGVQPISEISYFWKDSLVERQWLGLDRALRLPLTEDSLAALLRERQLPPQSQAATQHENLVLRFIRLGFNHILPTGPDHILFVLGLFFFATRMRPLLWQVTAFTIAHSITLGLALAGIFSLSSRIVEPFIALSIAVVGLENIFFRKVKASRWLIVFGFGLIHGMGFASALKELDLPVGKFWQVLAGFNFGVELGQLTVVTTAFVLTRWMWHKPWYFKRVVVPVSAVISAIALYWVVQRTIGI